MLSAIADLLNVHKQAGSVCGFIHMLSLFYVFNTLTAAALLQDLPPAPKKWGGFKKM